MTQGMYVVHHASGWCPDAIISDFAVYTGDIMVEYNKKLRIEAIGTSVVSQIAFLGLYKWKKWKKSGKVTSQKSRVSTQKSLAYFLGDLMKKKKWKATKSYKKAKKS